jgi:diguanylate cyclase (GGDEF)-like protein
MSKANHEELDDLFSLTSKFSSDILSLDEISEIWWHLANNIIEKFGFEDLVIYEYDNKKEILDQVAAFGNKTDGKNQVLNPIKIKLNQGIVGRCAFLRKPLLINNTSDYAEYIEDDANRYSELSIPIIVDGKLFGVIDSENSVKSFYTDVHLKSLSVIAEICGTKVSQLKAVKALQDIIKENEYTSKIQTALIEISETVYESVTLDCFYKNLHACISRLTFAKNFYVAYLDNEKDEIVFSYYVDESEELPPKKDVKKIKTNKSLTEYVLLRGQPVLLHESDINSLIIKEDVIVYGVIPKTWIGIPYGDGEKRGIVVVQSYSMDFIFTEKEIQILTFVAKHIHSAIERKEEQNRLTFLALHDSLTKLPNRALFQEKLDDSMLRVKNGRVDGLLVVYLDLDLFKEVNDKYGHKIGDKVLIASADLISGCLRESDVLSRLSGDEFAILLESCIEKKIINKILEKIISAFSKPMNIDGYSIEVSVSIGAAICTSPDISVDTLTVNADNAMYQSKLKGRNQYSIQESLNSNSKFPISKIEYDFLDALKRKDLYCVYQPIFEFERKWFISAESLVRWEHESIGVIPPDQFIPILEKTGLIIELDLYVLEYSISKLLEFQGQLPKYFNLNVNISTKGFASDRFIMYMKKLAISHPEITNRLCIEITEESLVGNVEVVKKHITLLRAMGVSVALDDFGTGYSSLNYLDQFDFDYLKIDKSFVTDLECSMKKQLILKSIIGLAKALNIKITAEGIETQSQYNLLQKMGCDFGQGYYISRPNEANKLFSTALDFSKGKSK